MLKAVLGSFAKLQKAASCLSVHPTVHMQQLGSQ
jgi:hypothetical protein